MVDALKEVHAWLEANPGEFVVLYLDDQEDIATWVSQSPLATMRLHYCTCWQPYMHGKGQC